MIEPYEVRIDDDEASILSWEETANSGRYLLEGVAAFEVELPLAYGSLTMNKRSASDIGGTGRPGDGLWFIFDAGSGAIWQYETERQMHEALGRHGVTPRLLRKPLDLFFEFKKKGELHWFPKPASRPTTEPLTHPAGRE